MDCIITWQGYQIKAADDWPGERDELGLPGPWFCDVLALIPWAYMTQNKFLHLFILQILHLWRLFLSLIFSDYVALRPKLCIGMQLQVQFYYYFSLTEVNIMLKSWVSLSGWLAQSWKLEPEVKVFSCQSSLTFLSHLNLKFVLCSSLCHWGTVSKYSWTLDLKTTRSLHN